ncbi:hypothetical protein GCM10007301_46050 [Azorhizobium oxalatiphilum]|uniref:DUF559 domain-containing protein n=1 Tax=Azorhizobium oxalatiphilum TaxID=980631 RepID=A0A917FGL9_9HYPH|nr:DUF559 domain-containing protein [Azorhizobium oxalatiphilum]GGF80766.1 hypothetical protein GCM10007301_46050 [Azorhizobium oxalatiphilum]
MSDGKRPMAHAPVSRRMKGHVKALRAQMTDAEGALWSHLRGHRLGASFRRQVPMGPYIGDFVCHAARLIVEVDGGQHSEGRDVARDAWFIGRGYRVVRYWNSDVLGNLDGVLEDLAMQLALDVASAERALPPSPTLPRKGGGGWLRGAESGTSISATSSAKALTSTAPTEQIDNKTDGAGGRE